MKKRYSESGRYEYQEHVLTLPRALCKDSHALPPSIDQLVERWVQALRVLDGMDEHTIEKHFDMGNWAYETGCGTIACLGGHCGMDQWFVAQGFKYQPRTHYFTTSPLDFFGRVGHEGIFLTNFPRLTKMADKFNLRGRPAWEGVRREVIDFVEFLKAVREVEVAHGHTV